MPGKDRLIINDDLFQKSLSCPLKFRLLLDANWKDKQNRPLFRQRNKLHIRDAIALQFRNVRHTSNPVREAEMETRSWLGEDPVAICGAVLKYENQLTRIPILTKEGKNFTIIQVHGRLRKRSEQKEITKAEGKGRSIIRYLMKAAFRLHVVKQCYPESTIDVNFYFPYRFFKSPTENLNLFSDEASYRQEFENLFAKVKATEGVKDVEKRIPGSVAHKQFEGLSITDVLQEMSKISGHDLQTPDIKRHAACKYCEFRLPKNKDRKGCWDRFFNEGEIQHPKKHVFELIGHGNNTETENLSFYQEDAALSPGFDSFENLKKHGGDVISIHQRRNLQILQAKDQKVPDIWIKPSIRILETLKYPLHFLDFEAATYAIPMKKGARPYDPVYFQFSCHTLFENEDLVHTEWLDNNQGQKHPHMDFVDHLKQIPDIFEGTILQYSPFEKQAINRLIGDFKKEPKVFKSQLQTLHKIRKSKSRAYKHRFFDMSKLINDAYFNSYLTDGLGLKPVLTAILQWENHHQSNPLRNLQLDELHDDFNNDEDHDTIPDPYRKIQRPGFMIADGSAAMNAWLAKRNGLLSPGEEDQITDLLRKYCTLDSFALFVIYKHLKRFSGTIQTEDFVTYDG